MIRDIMLPLTGTAGDANALAAAVTLATAHRAHLTVVHAVQLPLPAGPWGLGVMGGLEDLHEELRDRAEQEASEVRERLAREDVSAEVRVVAGFAERGQLTLPQARLSDLCVVPVSGQNADKGGDTRAFFSHLLFGSGRPVLAVPAHGPLSLPVHHAVIAWRPTREASRALHDAMPLLSEATSVDLVTVVEDAEGSEESGHSPGTDIATHLARHGLAVNVVNRPMSGRVSTDLLRHAAESGAQLLVAGGYGHSRLREWLLGGTTRELLAQSGVPVLFSH